MAKLSKTKGDRRKAQSYMEICIKIQHGVPYFTEEAKSLLNCAVRENRRTMVPEIQLLAFWTLSIILRFI
jgi:hypothetical protein